MSERRSHAITDRPPESLEGTKDPNRYAYHSILGLLKFPQTIHDLPRQFELPQDIALKITDKAVRGDQIQEFSWDIDFDP